MSFLKYVFFADMIADIFKKLKENMHEKQNIYEKQLKTFKLKY